jgi:16S rRNA (uracil1498-N3)-methyltransferase
LTVALHFLIDDQELAAIGEGDTVSITGTEAHHAAVVRRVRVGEQVTVGDGRGAWLEASVIEATPKLVRVEVHSTRRLDAPTRRLVLAQALAKGGRDELAVQAATELGVDAVIPWQASRSISRWDAVKAGKGVARWQSIAREASKQAHRSWVPEVHAPATLADLLAYPGEIVVLEPSAPAPLSAHQPGTGDILLVVGPEGGIAPDELEQFGEAGAALVRLGPEVLRTSTAGPAALSVLNARLGRW